MDIRIIRQRSTCGKNSRHVGVDRFSLMACHLEFGSPTTTLRVNYGGRNSFSNEISKCLSVKANLFFQSNVRLKPQQNQSELSSGWISSTTTDDNMNCLLTRWTMKCTLRVIYCLMSVKIANVGFNETSSGRRTFYGVDKEPLVPTANNERVESAMNMHCMLNGGRVRSCLPLLRKTWDTKPHLRRMRR